MVRVLVCIKVGKRRLIRENIFAPFSVKVTPATPSTRVQKPKIPLRLHLQKIQKRAKPLKSRSEG